MKLIVPNKAILHSSLNPKITIKSLIYFTIFYSLLAEFLIEVIGLPSFLRYITDFFNLLLFVFILPKLVLLSHRKYKPLFICFFLLVAFCWISSLLNSISPLLLIWASRNTFRGFIFFFACVLFLKDYDIKNIMHFLLNYQLVNCLFSVIQYLFFGLFGDYNGGLLGFEIGNGAFLNTINVLLLSYYAFSYVQSKETIFSLIICVGSCLICAVLSEEKMSFVVFALLFFFIAFISSGKKKKRCLLFLALVLVCGALLLFIVSPDSLSILTNFSRMEEYLNSDYENWVIPRFQSFNYIYNNIFQKELLPSLFGFGFGSGETSAFSFLQGPIFLQFGELHYRWFTVQWTYIETGLIGFILYISFFVIAIISVVKKWNKDKKSDSSYVNILCPTGIFCGIFCMISIWYNATLKVDASYLLFFGLSLGLVQTPLRKSKVNINFIFPNSPTYTLLESR